MENYIVYVGYLTLILYSYFGFFYLVESVIKYIEEDPEIQNSLLEKETQIQDVFYKLNESSDNVNSNAASS